MDVSFRARNLYYFVIGFSYILTQQKEQRTSGHQAASLQSDTWHWWSLLIRIM